MQARIERQQSSERTSIFLAAQMFGIGGATWTIKRLTGDGVSERPSITTVAAVAGYVYSPKQQRIQAVGAPDFTPTDDFEFVGLTTVDVREGDTLTSVTDATLVFQVMGVEARAGYVMATLEQL